MFRDNTLYQLYHQSRVVLRVKSPFENNTSCDTDIKLTKNTLPTCNI